MLEINLPAKNTALEKADLSVKGLTEILIQYEQWQKQWALQAKQYAAITQLMKGKND